MAEKRFTLGYPPRKKNDTSIGDAVNWEWLIHVAKENNSDICVVSRDGDFGVTLNSKGFINDWLQQEFKQRVNKKRNITLYPLLSQALKEFDIPVTKEEEQEESRVIHASINAILPSISGSMIASSDNEDEEIECGICAVPTPRSAMTFREPWGYICGNHFDL